MTRTRRLLLALACGFGALAAVVGFLRATPVAQAGPIIHYVAADCAVITATPCYTFIQAAINAASTGDAISVTQGVYHESLVLTKSISLQGGWNVSLTLLDWNLYTTTIDAQGAGPVVRIYGNASPTLEGFVLTGGDGTASDAEGGGVQIYQSSGRPIIRHNVIAGNIACRSGACVGRGGGLAVWGGAARIEHNLILSNVGQLGGAGGGGGGIYIGAAAVVTLTDNLVVSNTAVLAPTGGSVEGKGGGVYVDSARVTMTGNRLERNTALYGGGLFVYSSTGAIVGNWITANVAITRGGGLYLYRGAAPVLDANYVLSNTATEGGGICIRHDDAVVTLTNHLVAYNRATQKGGGVYISNSADVRLAGNHISENSAAFGGGIALESASGVISDNWIARNTAAQWGGGLFVDANAIAALSESESVTDQIAAPAPAPGENSVRVDGNRIYENRAAHGGGLFVESAMGTMARNTLMSNTADLRGGGLYLHTQAGSTLDANFILSNTAVTGEGGGVCIRGNYAPVTLTNHLIAHNGAARDGGGVYVFSSPRVYLVNNTLFQNNRGAGQEGVALLRAPLLPAVVTATNNLIMGHSVGVTVANGCTATLSHNDYYSNTIAVAGQLSGTTDLTLDPRFRDGDYHLSLASPLIDAGDERVNVPTDLDGQRRLMGRPDIGADEAGMRAYLPAVLRLSSAPPQPVQVYETTLTISTYGYTQAFVYDPHDPIHPYPRMNFAKVGPPAPRAYRAVVLENAYVRVIVLPELGGRVYAWLDKTSGRPIAYSNPVIKPVEGWGYRGWWLATGGIEWCLPTEEHGLNEYRPWQYATGADSVTVSDTESLTGLKVQVTLSLDRAHNYLTIRPRLTNDTPTAQTFEFWMNAMLAFSGNRVSDATRFIMPTHQVIVHSTGDAYMPGAGMTMSWPIYNERDVSVQGNLRGWLGVFAYPYAGADFAGAYDASVDLGVARVFSHTLTRGLKIFTPRNLPPDIWTDDDSNYFELWGGLSPAFGQKVTLASGASLAWTERWYPVSGLGQGFDYANAHAALRVHNAGAAAQVWIAATENLTGARVRLWHAHQQVQEWVVSVGPGRSVELVWPHSPTGALGVQLLDSDAKLLAQTGTVGQ